MCVICHIKHTVLKKINVIINLLMGGGGDIPNTLKSFILKIKNKKNNKKNVDVKLVLRKKLVLI